MKRDRKAFSLAEMLMGLLIVSVCLAATMPVITQKKLTGGNNSNEYWMSSNNSDIYYGLGNSKVVIGTNKTQDASLKAKLTIGRSIGATIQNPNIMFVDTNGSSELGRLIVDVKRNTGLGNSTMQYSNEDTDNNVAIGFAALNAGSNQSNTVAAGAWALDTIEEGEQNIGIGEGAGASLETGSNNTIVGAESLLNVTSGSGNIILGANAGPTTKNEYDNKLFIDNIMAAGDGSATFIYGNMDAVLANRTLAFNTNSITIAKASAPATYSKITAGNTTITNSSDSRLKNIKGNFNEGLDKIVKIQPKKFVFKKDPKKELHTGVIAQDIQKIFPNSVSKQPNGYLSVSHDEIYYAMINSIKELNQKNEKLSSENQKIENENKELKSQLNDIKERLTKLESGSSEVSRTHKKLGIFQKILIFFFGE